jgi:hypothetical protein
MSVAKGASLMCCLREVDDPRKPSNGTLHDFVEILVIAMAAVLSDCDTVEDIAYWAYKKEDWLRQFLPLKNGVPSEKTFLRIFRALDPKQFEVAFRRWVAEVVGALNGGIAVDGKTVRGSGSGGETAIHMVSAFATELGVVLGQEKVAAKSNEIVCHERTRRQFGGCGVSPEMRVGPSKSAYRSRFQTATSCVGKEPSW